jgi:hypothetical protein
MNPQQFALLVMPMPALDNDPARGNSIEEPIELLRALANAGFQCG